MARTLNPQLFGPTSDPNPDLAGGNSAAQNMASNKRLRDVEIQLDNLNQKLDRMAQVVEQKHQHVLTIQKGFDAQMRQLIEHFNKQLAVFASKINERRTNDAKVAELVDRHNQLVNSFETRLSHFQRLATEQEVKLMNHQATYDEVLKEIRSLRGNHSPFVGR
jgi:hypothetical protein